MTDLISNYCIGFIAAPVQIHTMSMVMMGSVHIRLLVANLFAKSPIKLPIPDMLKLVQGLASLQQHRAREFMKDQPDLRKAVESVNLFGE